MISYLHYFPVECHISLFRAEILVSCVDDTFILEAALLWSCLTFLQGEEGGALNSSPTEQLMSHEY